MSAFTSADRGMLTRRGAQFESSEQTLCVPMADPLSSGDDVSAIVIFEAGRCLYTDILSFSDLRKT